MEECVFQDGMAPVFLVSVEWDVWVPTGQWNDGSVSLGSLDVS